MFEDFNREFESCAATSNIDENDPRLDAFFRSLDKFIEENDQEPELVEAVATSTNQCQPCSSQTVKESTSANLSFHYQATSSSAGRSTDSALKQYSIDTTYRRIMV
jgi:hypothetical protein